MKYLLLGYTPVAARSIKTVARDVGGVFDGWQKIIAGLPPGRDDAG